MQVDLPKGGHGKCGGGPRGAGGLGGKEAEDAAGGGDDAGDQQGKALVLAACQRTLAVLIGEVKYNPQQADRPIRNLDSSSRIRIHIADLDIKSPYCYGIISNTSALTVLCTSAATAGLHGALNGLLEGWV